MFPFLGNACWTTEPISRKTYQEQAQVCQVDAGRFRNKIDTIERYLNQDETA